MQSKYPNACVALIGEDENAFAILERVQRAMREAGVPTAEVKAFTVDSFASICDTCRPWTTPWCSRVRIMVRMVRSSIWSRRGFAGKAGLG